MKSYTAIYVTGSLLNPMDLYEISKRKDEDAIFTQKGLRFLTNSNTFKKR